MRLRFLLAGLVLPSSGCFATRNDVRILQSDVLASRAEAARLDSARSRQMMQLTASLATTLGVVTDSLRDLSTRVSRLQGDTRQEMRTISEQLLSLGEATGMSQRRLAEFSAAIEARNQASAVAAMPPPVPGDTTQRPPVQPPMEGPHTLYQIGRDQLGKQSYSAARDAFNMLIRQYPESDLLPDAFANIGDSWKAEGRLAESDSAFQAVVTRYPASTAAPNALYKLGLSQATQGKRAEARAIMDNVIRNYPRSDAASLAAEWLRTNR